MSTEWSANVSFRISRKQGCKGASFRWFRRWKRYGRRTWSGSEPAAVDWVTKELFKQADGGDRYTCPDAVQCVGKAFEKHVVFIVFPHFRND